MTTDKGAAEIAEIEARDAQGIAFINEHPEFAGSVSAHQDRSTLLRTLHGKEQEMCALETEIIAMRGDLDAALSEHDALKEALARLTSAADYQVKHWPNSTSDMVDELRGAIKQAHATLTNKSDPPSDPTFQQQRRDHIYECATKAMVFLIAIGGVVLLMLAALQALGGEP
jgi:hypothetical protein